MPPPRASGAIANETQPDSKRRVAQALSTLERAGTRRNREGMARYGLVARKVFGVSVAELHRLAASAGRDHAFALGLWETGWYEARLLAAFVDEPEQVTSAQMERWGRDFENWGDCDTVVMHLFDRTPHAWMKLGSWCGRKPEFVKRAGFALIAALRRVPQCRAPCERGRARHEARRGQGAHAALDRQRRAAAARHASDA